jgi:dTDP-glucose 4,6-dehydratase
MKILVIGGLGFIGSNFVNHLLNKNHEVMVIDKLTYAGNKNNITNNKPYEFLNVDICFKIQRPYLEYGISNSDIILNFAAETHVDNSIKDSSIFLQTNFCGVGTILDIVKHYDKRFVQISTDEVYGTPETPSSENAQLDPHNPYSASKAAADVLVKSYVHTHGVNAIIVRMTNNYGPRQFTEKFIPLTITNALKNKPIPIYGDGKQMRDWLYVEDACEAIETIMSLEPAGSITNISTQKVMANIDVVKIILDVLGKPESLIKHVTDRPGHDKQYLVNSLKLRSTYGWRPRYDFLTGIKKTIEWYKED